MKRRKSSAKAQPAQSKPPPSCSRRHSRGKPDAEPAIDHVESAARAPRDEVVDTSLLGRIPAEVLQVRRREEKRLERACVTADCPGAHRCAAVRPRLSALT